MERYFTTDKCMGLFSEEALEDMRAEFSLGHGSLASLPVSEGLGGLVTVSSAAAGDLSHEFVTSNRPRRPQQALANGP